MRDSVCLGRGSMRVSLLMQSVMRGSVLKLLR